jgi:clan AA aspartic protease (TIGR02281 family)
MRRPRSGAAIIVVALVVLLPALLTRKPTPEVEARLDRASAASAPPRTAPALPVTERATHDVPLHDAHDKHLIVDGILNGRVAGPLLIDTGASYCVVTRTTARKLGLRDGAATRSIPVATANGNVDADLVTIDSLQLHGAQLAGVDAVVMDAVEPPLIGIIGLSFLRQFRFSVDPAAGTLRLER